MSGRAQLEDGYRGTLEHGIVSELEDNNIKFQYETLKIQWEHLTYRTYTPDFILDNGIIVEAKGRFLASERVRALAIKRQHPELDIRFVFTNSKTKLYKGYPSSYGEWCKKNGFKYNDKVIPKEWAEEKGINKHPKIITIENRRSKYVKSKK